MIRENGGSTVEFAMTVGAPESVQCDAVAAAMFADGGELEGAAAGIDRALDGALRAIIAEERFEAKPGRTLLVHTQGRIPAKRVIVVGLGPKGSCTLDHLRQGAAAVVRRAAEAHAAHVVLPAVQLPPHGADAIAQARAEGAVLGAYRFTRYKPLEGGRVERVTLLAEKAGQQGEIERGLGHGRLFADATAFARDLVNEPANRLPPARLAEIAAARARDAGLKCTVLDVDGIQALGMGGVLAVGGGSAQPPRLIVLEYAPSSARKTVALVGKGVTYDSGGINLKTQDLERMKDDMAGGAAVIAALAALPVLKPPVRVLGIVPAVENMQSGSAMKPGDIIRAMNGKTIEVNNTDAEGRLILADALAYAAQQRPDEIIDLATLTGSAAVAMGYLAAAVMSNDPGLVARLLDAAGRAGERMWQLPLYDEYLENMRSPVADLRNAGSRYGGAQKGAVFLREFVDGRPWAHVDIAPTAYLESDEGTGPYLPKGATGYGVRTLLTYLTSASGPGS